VDAALNVAGQQIRVLSQQTDDGIARLRRLDEARPSEASIRRSALHDAWNVLMDEGNHEGARTLMRLMNGR